MVLDDLSSRIAALEKEVAGLCDAARLQEIGTAESGTDSGETIDLSLDDVPEVTGAVPEAVTAEEKAEHGDDTKASDAIEVPEPAEMEAVSETTEIPDAAEVLEDGDGAGYGTAGDLPKLPVEEDIPADDKTEEEDIPVGDKMEKENSRTEETLFGEMEMEDTPHKGRHGKKAAGGAVMDVMAEKDAWIHDIPGPEVKSLRSAIGLGDQILYIRRLFRGDSALYQYAIDKLNSMTTLKEAVAYVSENFPEWDPDSDDVYRFMMSVRRKIRK